MKKFSLAFALVAVSTIIFFFSCTKINEATELGGDLIPGVDNVNTFEVSLNTITNNQLLTDSTKVGYNDLVALGDVNDPEFGHTHANLSFMVTPSVLGFYPFINKGIDSVIVDSVVLSLSYQGAWGDTVSNGIQTFRVYEIAPTSGFSDTVIYRFNDPASDFTNSTTGIELGSKTFAIKDLKDSIPIPTVDDSSAKVANVVRIKLDNSIGERFILYDTTSNIISGGFHSDSTGGGIFRKLFRGLAIKAENTGNALSYYSLADVNKTHLTVYFHAVKNGVWDTTSFRFQHLSNGRANYIQQDQGAQWAAYLNNGNPSDDMLYIQSAPSGAYASIVIPQLDNFENKVIHRAEIIASVLPSAQSHVLTPPSRLFIDHVKSDPEFTPYLFHQDISVGFDGSIDYSVFGGNLNNNKYNFNITRYVQGIITRNESNDTLRLYAPYRTIVYATSLGTKIEAPVGRRIADGRVVLGGGNYSDSLQRLRLRIIYSNL